MLEFVPAQHKTQEMYDKAVDRCFIVFFLFAIDILKTFSY